MFLGVKDLPKLVDDLGWRLFGLFLSEYLQALEILFRILSSEEINAMQEKAVTPMVDKVFKQGWPNGAWACTGEPVQVTTEAP